jgi:hypothetical protein
MQGHRKILYLKNMKRALFIFIVFFSSILCNAQIWPKTYTAGYTSSCGNAVEAYDGGLVIGGTLVIPSGTSYLEYIRLIKTDINGDTLWTKIIPNTTMRKFIETSDYGFLLIGTIICETKEYPLAIKLNSCAEFEWCKRFGYGLGSYFIDAVECPNNTYAILSNYTANGTAIYKLNNNGNINWVEYYPYYFACANSLITTHDNGFVISGYGYANSACAGLTLVKTDNTGQFSAVAFPDSVFGMSLTFVAKTIETADHGYLTMGSNLIRLYKLDSTFNAIWMKQYDLGSTVDTAITGEEIIAENDSTFIGSFTAMVDSNWVYTSPYFKMARFNSSGDTTQIATIYNSIPQTYQAYPTLSKTSDNKFLLGGTNNFNSNYYASVIKLNESLEIDSVFTTGLNYDSLCTQAISFDSITIDCHCPSPTGIDEESLITTKTTVYPNPVKDFLTISSSEKLKSVRMVNVFGQTVYERTKVNSNEIKLNVSSFSSGIYFISTGNEVVKFVKE